MPAPPHRQPVVSGSHYLKHVNTIDCVQQKRFIGYNVPIANLRIITPFIMSSNSNNDFVYQFAEKRGFLRATKPIWAIKNKKCCRRLLPTTCL
jgi:hypothetical protein